ncbi:hypothetical protein BS78_K308200 [Paspalum vaginatum]|uniref:Uncharacterized protein n=1 Tax=Paspalum vaginatum TaxID=158149 RepID=A0A9W7XAC1_9POAL|nr:hypothetical protein BS78_K308200 [Paspalum vaginatum]
MGPAACHQASVQRVRGNRKAAMLTAGSVPPHRDVGSGSTTNPSQ